MDFYENFVMLCNKAGKTPSKVAQEIGISKSIVSRWKNGGGVTDATARKVADYFGISVTDLKTVVQQHTKKPAGQKADELRGAGYYDLTPENRAMIDSLIDSLLKSQSGE